MPARRLPLRKTRDILRLLWAMGLGVRQTARSCQVSHATVLALASPPGVERIDVTTARDMQGAVHQRAGDADLIVMAAAVADFRPVRVAPQKIRGRPLRR